MRAVLLSLAAAFALTLLPAVDATQQDPATYPPGIRDVTNTPIQPRQEFEVAVSTDETPDSVVVTVCRFTSMSAEGPDVCFMNLAAQGGDGTAYRADTSAVAHPEWKDGWILGYKVTVKQGDTEEHAPSDGGYYRIKVGSPQEPLPEGTAVVEDSPPTDAAEAPAAPAGGAAGRQAGSCGLACALALLAAVLLARRT
jgi:hypothetical protein